MSGQRSLRKKRGKRGKYLQWMKNGLKIPKSTERNRRLAEKRKERKAVERLQRLQEYLAKCHATDSSDCDDSSNDESSVEDGYESASSENSSHEMTRELINDASSSARTNTSRAHDETFNSDANFETAADVSRIPIDTEFVASEEERADAILAHPDQGDSRIGSPGNSSHESSADSSDESEHNSSDQVSNPSDEYPDDLDTSSDESSDDGLAGDTGHHVQANLDEYFATMADEQDLAHGIIEDDDRINDPKDYKIGNSDMTRRQGEVLITAFATRHKITDEAAGDMLGVVDAHLPKPEYKSKYRFFKDIPEDEHVDYFYCESCSELLDFGEHQRMTKCPKCRKSYKKSSLKREGKCFIHRPLGPQLKKFLESAGFLELRKECEESDLVNGERYKLLRELGIIGDDDISITISTDGVRMFLMTKSSAWPFVVMINELPYKIRKRNLFLWGFWYGRGHPDMKLFLPILIADLKNLSEIGIECTPKTYDNPIRVKVHAILCIADTPAKALLLCMHQHNGEFSCPYCLHEGETTDPDKKNNARIFRGEAQNPRTEAIFLRDAEQVLRTGKMVHGMKDLTDLVEITTLSLPDSCPPEYMHAKLLGVVKMFLGAWFDSPNHNEPFYLGPAVEREFNRRMKNIKVPKEITRLPCDLGQDMKASQMRNILLYYSVPCLKGLMPDKYYKHWFLFVYGVSLCSQDRVPESNIQLAEEAFALFVQGVEPLYDKKYMRFVLHLTLHTIKFVRMYGGLWAWSAFPFEGYYGVLATLFHGTQYVPHQVCKQVNRLQYVLDNASVFSFPGVSARVKKLFMKLMGECRLSNIVEYGDELKALGKGRSMSLSDVEKNAIENLLRKPIKDNYYHYDRFIQKNILFTTSEYTRAEKRANHTVLMTNGEFVDMYALARVTSQNPGSVTYVLLGKRLKVQSDILAVSGKFNSSGVCSVACKSNEVVCHKLESIQTKCMCIPLEDDKICVTPIANRFETD